jgi:hypothetical protein
MVQLSKFSYGRAIALPLFFAKKYFIHKINV